MSKNAPEEGVGQQDLFGNEAARSLLDQLLTDSRLYTQSKDYKALLDFVVRLRNFAPFNAMLHINRNHAPAVQFASLAHELGHLFLGHLGSDKVLNVPQRAQMGHAQRELEAESVAFLVCARNGVTSKSETYLATYVTQNTTVDHIDLYQIMRAAGHVETLLGLTAHTKYDQATKRRPLIGYQTWLGPKPPSKNW